MNKRIWRNNKTGHLYQVEGTAIDATNATNGRRMVRYRTTGDSPPEWYVREIREFKEKFTHVP
jgi:hypothetical protein